MQGSEKRRKSGLLKMKSDDDTLATLRFPHKSSSVKAGILSTEAAKDAGDKKKKKFRMKAKELITSKECSKGISTDKVTQLIKEQI